jgi:hypothetical protein
MTRDTAKYRPLQRRKNTPHALRYLAGHHLGVQIQAGEHDPVGMNKIFMTLIKGSQSLLILMFPRVLMLELLYFCIISSEKSGNHR